MNGKIFFISVPHELYEEIALKAHLLSQIFLLLHTSMQNED